MDILGVRNGNSYYAASFDVDNTSTTAPLRETMDISLKSLFN